MEKIKLQKLSRTDKILVVLHELSRGTTKKLNFEDIVVALFSKYPNDFSLRGYSKYPDSEGVAKEFYRGKDLKNLGLIIYSNKIFSLTERGISYIEKIINSAVDGPGRLSRFAGKELKRIVSTEGFGLFTEGKLEKITDSDFFNYFGATSRTAHGDFQGRLTSLDDLIKELKNIDDSNPLYKRIIAYHDFLVNDKFKSIIEFYKNKK